MSALSFTLISRRTLLAGTSALLFAGLPSAEALAHAEFKASTPVANSVGAPPTSVTITFSEDISLKFSGATITGPEKATVKTGLASLGDSATLVVPIIDALKPGKYTVSWHNLSTDGHKLTGSFAFNVK